MKFYCIIPATKDKEGVCVLPTMQEPEILNLEQRLLLSTIEQIRYEDSHKLFRKHIKVDLPKFPTSCDRVGWFKGNLDYQKDAGEGWFSTSERMYEATLPEFRRKFIVPQSEEKVLASVPNWEVSNDPLVNKFLNEKNMIPYDQKITDLLEDFSKWQQAKEAWRKIEIYKEEGERYKKAYEELSEQVREIVGRTWEAGQQYGYYDANNANAGDIPDKETFIDGVLK
jgi:hypothetical protein